MLSGLKKIPIGANPRRYETWKPIIKVFESRLASWKGRNLSMGGHITLINSVLGILPLFFSFFKASKTVLNILKGIQQKFLWNGLVEKKGMLD